MFKRDKTVGPKSIRDTILSSTVPAFILFGNLIIKGTFNPLFPTALFCLSRFPPWSLQNIIIVFSNNPSSSSWLIISPTFSSIASILEYFLAISFLTSGISGKYDGISTSLGLTVRGILLLSQILDSWVNNVFQT